MSIRSLRAILRRLRKRASLLALGHAGLVAPITIFVIVIAVAGCGGDRDDPVTNDPAAENTPDSGDDSLQLQLPFEYTVGARTLEVPTTGGTVYVSVGPFGAHFQPLSGDPIGDAKSNLIGWFANDSTDLDELPIEGSGNGDGICDEGESCGFWGGPNGDQIRARIPTYVAPVDARLTRLRLNDGPDANYFDSVLHWEIDMELNSRYSLRIGHLGGIAPTLRDKILAATGVDTDSYAGPTGDLFSGANIELTAGDALAFPQVFAREVSAASGYYIGGGSLISPWAQMEFTIADHQEDGEVCVYDLMAPTEKAAIQATMTADMTNPDSLRYSAYATSRWVWSAEGLLCPVYSPQPLDFTNIHTRFGGWTERPESDTTVTEQFSIVKIEKTSSVYDVTNYDSSTVDYLALRAVGPGLPVFDWTMPDGTVAAPFLAVGEVIEETADTLLIKWRDIGWSTPAYQRAAFLLDSQGLKIKWGEFAASAADATLPTLDSREPCNDADTICHDHMPRL